MKGAYTQELSPVALYGQPLLLDDGYEQQLVEISQVIPQAGVTTADVTINANDRENNVVAEELEIWDGWLAQWRPVNLTQDLPDDVVLEVDQGAKNQALYQTRNGQGQIDNGTPSELIDEGTAAEIIDHSNLLEYYVYEDEPPIFTYINNSASQETVNLEFAGFAFNVDPINQPDGQPVYVPVEGIDGP